MKKYQSEIIVTLTLILVFAFGSIAGVILDRGGDYPFLKSEADYTAELTIEPEEGLEQVDAPLWPSGRIREYGGWFDYNLRIGYNDHDGYYIMTVAPGEDLGNGEVATYPTYWTHCGEDSLAAWIANGEDGLLTVVVNRIAAR